MGYRMYTVHERAVPVGAEPEVVLVREGFSWPAALFGPLWLLAHRLWVGLLVYLLAMLVLAAVEEAAGLNDAAMPLLGLGLMVLTGYLGPEAWRWNLARRGYGLTDVIGGRNLGEAERRLFGGWTADHRASFTPAARATPF